MSNFYYNLCGGLNTQLTPIIMGADSKKMYWADGFNVEPFKNQGIARQKGNKVILNLAEKIEPKEPKILEGEENPCEDGTQTESVKAFEAVETSARAEGFSSAFSPVALYAYPKGAENFVLALSDGRIFYVEPAGAALREVYDFDTEISSVDFEYFLDGLVILPKTKAGSAVEGIYFNLSMKPEADVLNFKNTDGEAILAGAVCGYAGRLWISSGDTLLFSFGHV